MIPVAILFSGGKDSALAAFYSKADVKCLISIQSENPESYMFHTPNVHLVEKQAEVMELPIIIEKTKGVKEEELKDLKNAIQKAVTKFGIKGVVTGAVASVYQSSRIQQICDDLGLECINPLWGKPQMEILEDLIKEGFEVLIIGVFGEGMDPFLGKKIDSEFLKNIAVAHEKYGVHPAGEGGEFESLVLSGPLFKKSLKIVSSHIVGEIDSKVLVIDELSIQ